MQTDLNTASVTQECELNLTTNWKKKTDALRWGVLRVGTTIDRYQKCSGQKSRNDLLIVQWKPCWWFEIKHVKVMSFLSFCVLAAKKYQSSTGSDHCVAASSCLNSGPEDNSVNSHESLPDWQKLTPNIKELTGISPLASTRDQSSVSVLKINTAVEVELLIII